MKEYESLEASVETCNDLVLLKVVDGVKVVHGGCCWVIKSEVWLH